METNEKFTELEYVALKFFLILLLFLVGFFLNYLENAI